MDRWSDERTIVSVTAYRVKAALAALVFCVPLLAAAAPSGGAPSFTNRHIFATSPTFPSSLWSVTLDSHWAAASRTRVRTLSYPTDMAGGRTLYAHKDAAGWGIWLLNAGGSTRRLADGNGAVFSPDHKQIVINRISRRPLDVFPHSELYLYRLSDGHETRLLALRDNIETSDVQFTHDGKSLWMHIDQDGSASHPAKMLLSTHHLQNLKNAKGIGECGSIQMLPGDKTMVTVCFNDFAAVPVHELDVYRLSDGKVLARHKQTTTRVETIHGRLDRYHLLVSVVTTPSFHHMLGSLDIRTWKVKALPHTSGFAGAVTEFN